MKKHNSIKKLVLFALREHWLITIQNNQLVFKKESLGTSFYLCIVPTKLKKWLSMQGIRNV
ncbi:hypothetical protein [Zophobihabitans entericus]|uniref:Uncharacterized protein n=1 Tax=Zophobihabitans entericus TaxID=1635327 RepID=A0A6G9IE78_9GAMM|nr:hypothetical protein [Zophobihabitans entericus]QIQ22122.1 hypothetical protein IPMB12_10775 [Zophobihabitans entericus]